MSQTLENYYQVLRVRKEASTPEIVAAYHVAKGAVTQEASSGRLGFSAGDVASYLRRIEEAYSTLTDPRKRRDYDDVLRLIDPIKPQEITGEILRKTRENLNMSREELFRITRIPLRYLQAIEEEIVNQMPARVYLQGFIKNLAQVYRLNPQETARLFLEYFDKNLADRVHS
ncbi:MAG: helix-turn-helix domain-containing protein [Pseudomonadota bacterium]